MRATAVIDLKVAAVWADRLAAVIRPSDAGEHRLDLELGEMGLAETEGSITVKINRGTFPAWFLFVALKTTKL